MATQNSQSQVIGAQGGFPTQDVGGQEAPNPMDQSYGPSPSGSGSRAV